MICETTQKGSMLRLRFPFSLRSLDAPSALVAKRVQAL
jgi:hypothetical protein